MKRPRVYHIGFVDSRITWPHPCRRVPTLIVQMRHNVDLLSCDLWRYMGERVTTKTELRRNRLTLLAWVNKAYNQDFRRIVIE